MYRDYKAKREAPADLIAAPASHQKPYNLTFIVLQQQAIAVGLRLTLCPFGRFRHVFQTHFEIEPISPHQNAKLELLRDRVMCEVNGYITLTACYFAVTL
jgi:hypothetical protein